MTLPFKRQASIPAESIWENQKKMLPEVTHSETILLRQDLSSAGFA